MEDNTEAVFFNNEKIKEMQECFKMFDKDKDGYVSITELKNILRAINHDFVEDELIELIKEVPNIKLNRLGSPVMNYSQFEYLIKQTLKYEDISGELTDAFMNFVKDENSSSIPVEDFIHYMKNLGDKLSDEEVEEMVKDCDPNGQGYIDCKSFVNLLISK